MKQDRSGLISKLITNCAKLMQGAVYFMSLILHGNMDTDNCFYSIRRILEVFNQILKCTTCHQLTNAIVQSIYTFVQKMKG
jgi:hypothetical protein